MGRNQFETRQERGARSEERAESSERTLRELVPRPSPFVPRAFTLTELLVVITIIAILAALITGAAVNAMRRARQATITLEISQLANSLEDFRNTYGAYPPNVYPIFEPMLDLSDLEKKTVAQDFLSMMKRVSARSTEFRINLSGSVPVRGQDPSLSTAKERVDNLYPILDIGISPEEALVFWLGGFSDDVTRPLTGTDLTPSVSGSGIVTIDSRKPLYDFDRGRLVPTRVVDLLNANGVVTEIQLYKYLPPGSKEPFLYFDTSRRTPAQTVSHFPHNPDFKTIPGHEMFYRPSSGDGYVVPLKQDIADAPANPTLQQIEYVNQRKFQIVHCGIDDIWGNMAYDPTSTVTPDTLRAQMQLNDQNVPPLRYPTGPFLGDVADTVGNFGTGTLASEQQ